MNADHWAVWAFAGAVLFYCLPISSLHPASRVGVTILGGPLVWLMVGYYTAKHLLGKPTADLGDRLKASDARREELTRRLHQARLRAEDLETILGLIVQEHHDPRGDTVLSTAALISAEHVLAGNPLERP